MKDHPQYSRLIKDWWDDYRNIDLVWKTECCKSRGFNKSNTLMIESKQEKIQLYLNNSIICRQYDFETLAKQMNPAFENTVSDESKEIMKNLTDFVLEIAEKCDNVPEWLIERD